MSIDVGSMADAESDREKKKKIHRKIDRDFDSFGTEKMKIPSHYSKKSLYKSSQGFDESSNNFHSGGGYWDKRNNRKYQGDSSYKGWKIYEGSKEDKIRNDNSRPPGDDVEAQPVVTPVILTRVKEPAEKLQADAAVALIKKTEMLKREPNPIKAPKPYQIASKPSALEGIVLPEVEMNASIKLLDEYLDPADDFSSYLLDQNNFLVVAVVGLQSCGKSTIASLLADPSKVNQFTSNDSWVFKPESRDEVLSGCHSTNGIDAFVTKERVIILDLQPLLSPSVMDYFVTQERKASLDFGSTENLLEVESLQLLTLAMSISHVLVVVQDYIFHPNLIRLLHTCQMMKPTPSSNQNSNSSGHQGNRDGHSRSNFDGSDAQQYFPHLVLVHNRTFSHHFLPQFVNELQSLYQSALGDSSLCLDSQIGICSSVFSPPLGSTSTNLNLNLFLLPDINQQDKCPLSLMDGIKEMRRQIFSLSRCPLTHVSLTEKSWLQYATRMWDSIRKSSLYVEYSRLLP